MELIYHTSESKYLIIIVYNFKLIKCWIELIYLLNWCARNNIFICSRNFTCTFQCHYTYKSYFHILLDTFLFQYFISIKRFTCLNKFQSLLLNSIIILLKNCSIFSSLIIVFQKCFLWFVILLWRRC